MMSENMGLPSFLPSFIQLFLPSFMLYPNDQTKVGGSIIRSIALLSVSLLCCIMQLNVNDFNTANTAHPAQ